MNKTMLISGVTGQDGAYLSRIGLEHGYKVYGLQRRVSVDNTWRIKDILSNPDFELISADITDGPRIAQLINTLKPTEIYNLGAQSHVRISFDSPISTFEITGKAVIHFLEAIRQFSPSSKFYQASSSEMFGSAYSVDTITGEKIQNEYTPLHCVSPYGAAKVFAHNICGIYRDSYKLRICRGTLFNHESAFRGENFVTRKISLYISNKLNNPSLEPLKLGNLEAKRDWGHAIDFCQAMFLMMQYNKCDDYCVSTDETHSVREFAQIAFSYVGLNYLDHIIIDKDLYRPIEVDYLRGDSTKIRTILGWRPTFSFKELIYNMVDSDINGQKTSKTPQTSTVF